LKIIKKDKLAFGLRATLLVALITAAPGDSQTVRSTTHKENASSIRRMETFMDAFSLFFV